MMINKYQGKAIVLGDNIDTDTILPGRYLTITDEKLLAPHAFEGWEGFYKHHLSKETILVAGKNFGCGSSREGAPLAIKGNGLKVILTESFARIFYRNSVNVGLMPIECKMVSKVTKTGDIIEIDIRAGEFRNITRKTCLTINPVPVHVQSILESGGLIHYLKPKMRESR